MACQRGAGSSSPVSHAMGDSELSFALQAMLLTEGVSSRISLVALWIVTILPLQTRSSQLVEQCAYICKLVTQFLGKRSFLESIGHLIHDTSDYFLSMRTPEIALHVASCHLTAGGGGWCAADVPELPCDVLERVFPMLPARALLRALAVCRCGSGFT